MSLVFNETFAIEAKIAFFTYHKNFAKSTNGLFQAVFILQEVKME